MRRPATITLLRWAGLALLGAALALAGCPREPEAPIRVSVEPGGPAAEPTPEQIPELARAEGELAWYTSLPQADADRLQQAFARRYPFIRPRVIRGGSFTLAEQVFQERQTGKVQGDVLHLLDPATFVRLRNEGGLLYYDSPSARSLPPAYRDTGYWAALRAVTLCLAYNARRLSGPQAPRGWEDLLRPALAGRVGVKDAETAGAAYACHFLLRERYGTAYWEKLARQQPRVYKTEEQMLEALQRGDIDVAVGVMGLNGAKPSGALKLLCPADGVPMMVGPVGILDAAPHPNCARLFVDFLLSAEGQKLVTDTLGAYSLLPGAAPPAGREPLGKLHLLAPRAGWSDYAAKRELLRGEFSNLLGGSGE